MLTEPTNTFYNKRGSIHGTSTAETDYMRRKMGSDYGVMDRVQYPHPLAFGLSLNCQYSPFQDALKKKQKYQDHLDHQRYIECFSYLSYHGNLSVHDYSLDPAFLNKRNERERQRVRCVNEGYARLREHLPQEFEDKRLSKVETLRAAIGYIKHLQNLLDVNTSENITVFRERQRNSRIGVSDNNDLK